MANVAKATKVQAVKAPKDDTKRSAGFRVYHIDDGLRSAIQRKRAQANVCTREIIQAAITEKLPVILQGLSQLGLTAKVGQKKRPFRAQIADSDLSALKLASAQCGLAQSTILLAAIGLLCSDAPKAKAGRKGGAK